jgi:two-component system sensor histidine kinase HydH
MGLEWWVNGAAAVLFLALGVLSLARGARSPLAPPLAWLSIAFFAYDTIEIVRHLSDAPIWDWLDGAAAAMVAPPTLHLVATFVGRRRALRIPLGVGSVWFGGIALACLSPLVGSGLVGFAGSPAWAIAMLIGIAPSFGAVPFVLAAHARTASAEERARTQLFGAALLLGVGGVCSDLFAIAGGPIPRVAAPAIMISVVLLGALTFRARILEGITRLAMINAVVLALLAVAGHLIVLAWLGDHWVLLVLGAVAVTLALLAALRPLVALITEERERTRHLALLGRFSSQMAHDLRNPLAAIKGAAQFLAEEAKQGRSLADQSAFLTLIVEQSDRLGRVIEGYQRLGRVEAVPAAVDVVALVEEVAIAQRAAALGEDVELTTRVMGEVPRDLALDRDLMLAALENLVRNAREALAGSVRASGRVAIVVEAREREIVIAVEDDGAGMDARTRERAFDEFYTTKTTGSGLGLAYVARVATAHGGRAAVESRQGQGTRVELRLPNVRAAR